MCILGSSLFSRRRGAALPFVTLTTTKVGTFTATTTKTGAPLEWKDDQGNSYTGATPSFVYGDAGTKTITITSSDGWSGLTDFRCQNMDLTTLVGVEAWTDIQGFRISGNAELTFDIAVMADWRPETAHIYSSSVSGDVAALAGWRPTLIVANATAIIGDIASLADWRPTEVYFHDTNITGDIASLADWRPANFYASDTAVSGDIAALADWRPTNFRVYDTSVTCSGTGGAAMAANVNLAQYRVNNAQIDTTGLNAIVVDLWTHRANGADLTIIISGNPGALTQDSIDRIEGTGAYAGDGIKTYGATVTYDVSVVLKTTKVGTFTASVTKSGSPLVWKDDQGNEYTGATPSFEYGEAGTKTITITTTDGWSGLTAFTCDSQDLTTLEGIEAWTAMSDFRVNTNSALAFDISALADWRPVDFRVHATSVSGDIAALADWSPTNFHVNSTSVSGDIAALANWLPTNFYAHFTAISGDIAALADWRPTIFWVYATSVSGDIAALADWRPGDFRVNSTSVSGDIAALADWSPTNFYVDFTSVSGDIAALADWRPTILRVHATSVTCSGAGGAEMATNTALAQYRVENAQIDTTGLNAIVADLWTHRANGAGLIIDISGNPGALTQDSIDRIEGTGVYAGDGIKTYGASVTYDVSVVLKTTKVGTFTASVTKSGSPLVWKDDQGNEYTGATPSFVYGSAGTKTIIITTTDGWSGLTEFTCSNQNLTAMEGIEAWTAIQTCDVTTNTALVFDITALADWRPNDARFSTTSVTGDIAALADWRPLVAGFSATGVTGDIADWADWRPQTVGISSTGISGDIAALADWRPNDVYFQATSISGDIAALVDWRPKRVLFYSSNITCSGAGGAEMAAYASLDTYRVENTQIDTTGLNAIVVDLWTHRANGAGLTIDISGNPGVLTQDSIDRIEGTGAYAGDGIKTYGANITY